jgi:hypothetical protein
MKETFICAFLMVFCLGNSSWAEELGQPQEGELPRWKYKIGADERIRYEYKHDFDFNKDIKDNGSLFFARDRLNVKATLSDGQPHDWIEVFVEGLNAQTGSYQTKATAGQTDDFDLHQSYLAVYNVLGSPVDLKIGRQELKYGKGRLIAAPVWSNRIRSFDAAVTRYHSNGLYADLLYAQDVKYDDNTFNRSLDEESILGTYIGYQKDKKSSLLEGYFLTQIISSGSATIKRYTAGPRWRGTLPWQIVLDIEAPSQFGTTGTKDIRAYAVHMDASRDFTSLLWKPTAVFSYDQASGDRNPDDNVSNTFIPLYQSTHEPYGLLDFFRWQNIRNPEVSIAFSPTAKFKFTPQASFFWLESKSDSWYNSSGTAVRTKTTGDRSPYIGSEASLRAYYDFNKHIKLEAGYAHFFSGEFVGNTGANDDADWMYFQVNVKY